MKVNVGDVYVSKSCGEYEVVDYRDCYHVTVKFKNTGNIKNVQADRCRKGLAVDTKKKEDDKTGKLQSREGEVYQDLEVIRYSGDRSYLVCLCRCGTEVLCSEYNLLTGHDKSCGCKTYLKDQFTLYEKYPRERSSYEAMLCRCKYINPVNRKSYWDKNITACDRWLVGGLEGFINFIEDMGEKPDESCQLDRINTNGNYTPENCRWVSRKVNINNRGNTIKVLIFFEQIPLIYILDMLNLNPSTVRDRYNSGLPFKFVFHKGSLRYNLDYKRYKDVTNTSVKKVSGGLGKDIMTDPDEHKLFESLYGEKILTYIKEEHGEIL